MPVQILRASHLESCRSSAPVLKHSSFVLGFWHSLASRDELEAAKLPKQTIKRLWQPNADASTWKRSGTRGHKKEKYPTAYLLVGWQEFKIIKLKKPPSFKAPLHVVNLPKALREKKEFQHGGGMERQQEDYLKSYKNAMLWNVILYSNTSVIGMVSSHFT